MKRLLVKLLSFSILVATGWFTYYGMPSQAATLSCWEQAYNKWMGCDGAYLNTRYLYLDGNNYCTNNAATTCSATANTFCTTQASTSCTNDPNPQQCQNTAYNNCYPSQYQSCHTTTTIECLDNLLQAYNNRGNAYQTCLGFEGNYGNCIEEVEFSCVEAQSRASACNSVYADADDGSAQATCRANSGIDQCQ